MTFIFSKTVFANPMKLPSKKKEKNYRFFAPGKPGAFVPNPNKQAIRRPFPDDGEYELRRFLCRR